MKKMIPLIIFMLLAIFLIAKCTSTDSTKNEEDLRIQAWVCAENVVKENLKAPSSADFCSYPTADIEDLGNGIYRISGWVDAQNDFGATIRTDFVVILELTARGYKNAYVTFNE